MSADQTTPTDAAKVSLTLEQLAQLKSEVLLHAPYAPRVSLGLVVRLVTTGDLMPALHEIDGTHTTKTA